MHIILMYCAVCNSSVQMFTFKGLRLIEFNIIIATLASFIYLLEIYIIV